VLKTLGAADPDGEDWAESDRGEGVEGGEEARGFGGDAMIWTKASTSRVGSRRGGRAALPLRLPKFFSLQARQTHPARWRWKTRMP
jgi:hypothetical protein